MSAPTASLPPDDRYVLLTITRLCAQANGQPVSRSAIAADMHQAGIPAARRTRQALIASIMALAVDGHVALHARQRVAPMGGVKPVEHHVIEDVNFIGHRVARCTTCKVAVERWPLRDDDEMMFGDKRWAARVKRFRNQHPEPRP